LTPCCALEEQNPTQALKRVEGPGNTFDFNTKWAKAFPFGILNRYIMFGRGICEKYQSRDETFPEPKGEENLFSRLILFANTTPNIIYLCNYTEYYLKYWLNK
jgi:hypothetical protein